LVLENFAFKYTDSEQIRNLERSFDGNYNGTGLPPTLFRIIFSLFTPASAVSAGKTIITGKDLYNRNANNFLDRGILAPFNLISPFCPTAVESSDLFKTIYWFNTGHTISNELVQP